MHHIMIEELRLKALMLREQADLLEGEANALEAAINHPKRDHVIMPAAATISLREDE